MKHSFKRLNRKGETIIETLFAIIVLTISSMLLANITASSIRINNKAEENDDKYRAEIAAVEKMESGTDGKVTIYGDINSYSYDVEYYGNTDGLTSYRLKEGGI